MVNINDCRVGNCLHDRHENVVRIANGWFYLVMDPKRLLDYKPIHISKQILKDAGFKHNDHYWYCKDYDGGDMEIQYNILTGKCRIIDKEYRSPATMYKIFTELHILQNVYYFLTGEELEMGELK